MKNTISKVCISVLICSISSAFIGNAIASTISKNKAEIDKGLLSSVKKNESLLTYPSVSTIAKKKWNIKPGIELASQLDEWATMAGWQFVWEVDYAYLPKMSAEFSGEFIPAVTQLFYALQDVNPPIYPALYKENNVLVVRSKPHQ